MYSASMFLLIAILIPLLLLTVTFLSSRRSEKDREKISPFECGFDPSSTARIPFSLRFFLLAVIFLVFDIEIVLLMPMILLTPNPMSQISTLLFLMILTIGLFHEWNEGSLDWT